MKKKKKPVASGKKAEGRYAQDEPVQLSLPFAGCRKCGQATSGEYCEKCRLEVLTATMAQMGR